MLHDQSLPHWVRPLGALLFGVLIIIGGLNALRTGNIGIRGQDDAIRELNPGLFYAFVGLAFLIGGSMLTAAVVYFVRR